MNGSWQIDFCIQIGNSKVRNVDKEQMFGLGTPQVRRDLDPKVMLSLLKGHHCKKIVVIG